MKPRQGSRGPRVSHAHQACDSRPEHEGTCTDVCRDDAAAPPRSSCQAHPSLGVRMHTVRMGACHLWEWGHAAQGQRQVVRGEGQRASWEGREPGTPCGGLWSVFLPDRWRLWNLWKALCPGSLPIYVRRGVTVYCCVLCGVPRPRPPPAPTQCPSHLWGQLCIRS